MLLAFLLSLFYNPSILVSFLYFLLLCFLCRSIFKHFRKIANSDLKLRHVCPSEWDSSTRKGGIFIEFDIWDLENLWRKFECPNNLTRMTCMLCEELCKFIIIYLSVLLRIQNISDKYVENFGTHNICLIIFFPKMFAFMKRCGKIFYIWTGYRWKYNMERALCMPGN